MVAGNSPIGWVSRCSPMAMYFQEGKLNSLELPLAPLCHFVSHQNNEGANICSFQLLYSESQNANPPLPPSAPRKCFVPRPILPVPRALEFLSKIRKIVRRYELTSISRPATNSTSSSKASTLSRSLRRSTAVFARIVREASLNSTSKGQPPRGVLSKYSRARRDRCRE